MNIEKYLASDGYYHYIYKITFTTTDQYYYGQHSVLSSHIKNDKYMGSGKKLNKCYQLSGYQDAVKEICCGEVLLNGKGSISIAESNMTPIRLGWYGTSFGMKNNASSNLASEIFSLK